MPARSLATHLIWERREPDIEQELQSQCRVYPKGTLEWNWSDSLLLSVKLQERQ